MAITPLQVTSQVGFSVMDGTVILFDSRLLKNIVANQYLQAFDDSLNIPDATVDLQINTETVTNIQALFFMSDQALTIKIQPQGALLTNVQALTMAPGLPSILALNNVVGIYVSNATGTAAKLTICGAGI